MKSNRTPRFHFVITFSVLLILMLLASGCAQNSKAQIIKQVQGYLPETVQLKNAEYESEKVEDNFDLTDYIWRLYDSTEAVPDFWVIVSTNASGRIIMYENTIQDHYLADAAEKTLDETAAKQLATSCMTDWSKEEALELKPWGSNTAAFETLELSEHELGWTAASAAHNYYYDIIINTKYGYVKRFEKYYANPQLR